MANDVATCNGAEDAGRADQVAGQQVSGGGPDVAVAPFSADGLKLRAADVLARGPGGPHISGGPPAADEATPELFGLCVEAVKSLLAERRTDVRRCCGDGVEQAELVGWLAADATEREMPGAVKARALGKRAAKEAAAAPQEAAEEAKSARKRVLREAG